MKSNSSVIACRRLCFSRKNESERRNFSVLIGAPYLLTEEVTNISFADAAAGCDYWFDGLDEKSMEVHGADTLQAIELAVNDVDKYLRQLSRKYDFFFPDSERYFED